MERLYDLDAVLDHIRDYIHAAVDDRQNAMTTPTFASAGPAARTVALREADFQARTLMFHTDIRSSKIDELDTDARAAFVAWDADISQQFQLSGSTSIHDDDELADRFWASEAEEQRSYYYKSTPPADPIEEPISCIDKAAVSDKEARTYFAVVRTVIDQITWLHLHPQCEYRARFRWDGDSFAGNWIVP